MRIGSASNPRDRNRADLLRVWDDSRSDKISAVDHSMKFISIGEIRAKAFIHVHQYHPWF